MKHFVLPIIIAVLLLICPSCFAQRYNIIPKPLKVIEQPGDFRINSKTILAVTTKDSAFIEVVNNFAKQIKITAGIKLHLLLSPSKLPEKNVIIFSKAEDMNIEAYQLQVSMKRIKVTASKPNGLFYGVQSICQLLPAEIYGATKAKNVSWTVPCCNIQDEPQFSYRGLMLDVGRYFMPKEFVMKLIDLMSMHKQNMFHWHLTDDQGWRIEIKKYPKLTTIGAWRKETSGYGNAKGDGVPHGGFYTQEDIKEVVEYARQRYVTVVPEIEMPGHASAAVAAYPELSCFPDRKYTVPTSWGVKDDVFCPTVKTFQFLEDVFTEMFKLFPSPYYHIGGDECPKVRWKESSYCQDLMKLLGTDNIEQLQTFFVQRMDKFLREKGGKKVIGWDEILDAGAVPSTIPMSYRGHAPAMKALSRNMYTIMAPNRWCYLDYYQEDPEKEPKAQGLFLPLKKVYDYNPIGDTVSVSKYKYILGLQGCIWTEFIQNPKRVEYMAFPRAVAMSEVAWSKKSDKNWDSFCQRMVKDFKRMDEKKVNYSKAFFHVIFNFDRKESFPKQLTLTLDMPNTTIHYTTDGSKVTLQSPVYTSPLNIVKGSIVHAQGYNAQGKAIGVEVNKTF